MTQSYAETTFNVPLTGQQISEIYFYLSYYLVGKQGNLNLILR